MFSRSIDDLYSQARDGNKSAEDELYRKLAEKFRLFAHRKVWNSDDADEIVQDALATVLAGYRETEIETSFAGWAHKVLENKFLSYIQTKRRQSGRSVSLDNPGLIAGTWEPDPDLSLPGFGNGFRLRSSHKSVHFFGTTSSSVFTESRNKVSGLFVQPMILFCTERIRDSAVLGLNV